MFYAPLLLFVLFSQKEMIPLFSGMNLVSRRCLADSCLKISIIDW